MTTPFIKDQPYLTQDRVNNLTLSELVVCSLCQGILWLPVACRTCEIPYCSSCIKSWKLSEPTRCPSNNCSQYNQRDCPRSNITILSLLQVVCRYRSHGCTQTLPYNNLETHEEECGFRPITCSGCQEKIVKKDFKEHHRKCLLVLLTCPECDTIYQRQNEGNHTETICLRVQLHKLRDQVKQNEKTWNDKFSQLQRQVNHITDTTRTLK
jgi:hypothetical protein